MNIKEWWVVIVEVLVAIGLCIDILTVNVFHFPFVTFIILGILIILCYKFFESKKDKLKGK